MATGMSITEAAASVAARAFFYPSLAWNIARNRLQETWHWWDEITETVVLGALPFYSTLEQLKQEGVTAVVTLNEEFEVFITPEQYQSLGFAHLHIPTVDFLYAPPLEDLHRGADFIYSNGEAGGKTYVHCKAGRGRSTTLVLCYLIKHHAQTPEGAYKFVRERRPQVYLAQGQWTAVCGFYISCHPDERLALEDFPYPSFLPQPADKPGCDGPAIGGESAAPAGRLDVKVGGQAGAEPQGLAPAGDLSDGELRSPFSSTEPDFSPHSRGTEADADADCGGELSGSAVRISASAQAAGSEDVVSLPSLGSQRSGADGSIAQIASALSTCCVAPRAGKGGSGPESDAGPLEGPPERASSPAIEIPRSRAAVTAAGAPSPREASVPERSASSKGSIQLEPSGSLPGYVRIAPIGARRSSGPAQPLLPLQTTLTATGFSPIEDWAAVEGGPGAK